MGAPTGRYIGSSAFDATRYDFGGCAYGSDPTQYFGVCDPGAGRAAGMPPGAYLPLAAMEAEDARCRPRLASLPASSQGYERAIDGGV